jgi:hypothetical protein
MFCHRWMGLLGKFMGFISIGYPKSGVCNSAYWKLPVGGVIKSLNLMKETNS